MKKLAFISLAGLFGVFFLANISANRVKAQQMAAEGVLPSVMPYAQAGQAYNSQIFPFGIWTTLTGAPPPGLTLSGNLLVGTPTHEGNYTFIAQSQAPVSALSFNIGGSFTVCVYSSALVFVTPHLPVRIAGSAYSYQLAAQGGTAPYSFTLAAGTLPAGLTLSTAGLVSGTPTAATPLVPITFLVTDASKVTCYGNPAAVPRTVRVSATF
jgi:hypothetical protein